MRVSYDPLQATFFKTENFNTNICLLDSIAGQMHALKTGQAPKKKAKKASDDSSDESDTDGDAGDTSDTNTETEDED
jgi:translocation protein SEC63